MNILKKKILSTFIKIIKLTLLSITPIKLIIMKLAKKNSNSKGSNSNDSNSNSSTNNKTMNSTVTNFNLPGFGYGYMNTINALNMCYYQKYFLENGLYNGNSNCAFVGAESCGTHKKETSLKEIFDNNKSYPFVCKIKEKRYQ